MNNKEIDRLIDRARRAYLRRRDFKGRAPIINDCDIVVRGEVEIIELREGEAILAHYALRQNGELRFLPDGKY